MSQMEVALGLRRIAQYLSLERLRIGEAPFFTNTLEEGQFQWRLFGQFDGMKIEKVRLDGKGVFPEGRTIACIGHSVEDWRLRTAADLHARDINPVGRK